MINCKNWNIFNKNKLALLLWSPFYEFYKFYNIDETNKTITLTTQKNLLWDLWNLWCLKSFMRVFHWLVIPGPRDTINTLSCAVTHNFSGNVMLFIISQDTSQIFEPRTSICHTATTTHLSHDNHPDQEESHQTLGWVDSRWHSRLSVLCEDAPCSF